MNNRIAYLVSKKLTCEISETETQELNGYLTQDTELYKIIDLLEFTWQQAPLNVQDEPVVEKLIDKLHAQGVGFSTMAPLVEANAMLPEWEESKPKSIHLKWMRVLRMAAALCLLALAVWWAFSFFSTPAETNIARTDEPVNQVVTMPGNRTSLVLRDGTRVWLNADSKLTYANNFGGSTREVNLSGEAYFEVVSNPAHPFIIHTPRTTVKVTGTFFNVRDYPGEALSETSLIKGRVEVRSLSQPEKAYILEPNEKIILKMAEPKMVQPELATRTVQKLPELAVVEISRLHFDPIDSIPVETAWVKDQLAFNDASFRQIADKMEKWYNTKIEFSAGTLEMLRFTGKFEKETLDQALEALQFTTSFRYRRQGKTIVIYQ